MSYFDIFHFLFGYEFGLFQKLFLWYHFLRLTLPTLTSQPKFILPHTLPNLLNFLFISLNYQLLRSKVISSILVLIDGGSWLYLFADSGLYDFTCLIHLSFIFLFYFKWIVGWCSLFLAFRCDIIFALSLFLIDKRLFRGLFISLAPNLANMLKRTLHNKIWLLRLSQYSMIGQILSGNGLFGVI